MIDKDSITLTPFEKKAGITVDDKLRELTALDKINKLGDEINKHYSKEIHNDQKHTDKH